MFTVSESLRTNLRTNGTLLARIFIGALFLTTGVRILLDGAAGMTSAIDGLGLPFAALLAWVVVVMKMGGGAGVLLGYKFDLAALTLVVFVTLAIVFVHADFSDGQLYKDLAIIGCLLYMLAYGPGDGWKLGR